MAQTQRSPDLAPPPQMGDMMATLGVAQERFNTPWGDVQLRQATRRCQTCPDADRCRLWLHNYLRDAGGYRSFCANAGLFDRYRTHRY